MRKIAIIPARGGSKRIPRKNIKPFFGKPVIAYAIELALKSKLFDRVIVSTDDDEIADIARSFGAGVPFMRSTKNATDTASTFDVLKEVLEWYKQKGEEYEIGCCIYPVSPLIKLQSLKESLTKLVSGDYDSVIPIARFSHPIQRAMLINNKGEIAINNFEDFKKNTQELEVFYHDTGQFYWFDTKKCLIKNKLLDNNSTSYILDNDEYQDVDNLEDWQYLELKFMKLNYE